jgi:hypothetical protein
LTARLAGASAESKTYRRPDEARAESATAVAMLREMGMALWLSEAEPDPAGAGR